MGWNEYIHGPWRIRAVAVQAHVDTWQDPDDPPMQAWLWFVSRLDIDEWFAHGISDTLEASFAEELVPTIDGEEMDVILSYGGVEWDMIEGVEAHVANLQRILINTMSRDMLDTLKKLGRSEIVTLREAEENVVDQKLRK